MKADANNALLRTSHKVRRPENADVGNEDKLKMIVRICDLYPYEPSGVRAKVKRQKKAIESGTAKPIQVLPVDGELLVLDGTNRVLAAIELNMSDIEATEAYKREQEMRPYRDALAAAQAAEQRGFKNVPADPSMRDRGKRY